MIACLIRTSLWWVQLCWLFSSFPRINGIIKTILGQRRFGQALNSISFSQEGKKATHDTAIRCCCCCYYRVDFTICLLLRIGCCEVRSIHIQNMIQPWNNKSHLLDCRSYFYISIFYNDAADHSTNTHTHNSRLSKCDFDSLLFLHR